MTTLTNMGHTAGKAARSTGKWLKNHPKTTHAAVGVGAFSGGAHTVNAQNEALIPGISKRLDAAVSADDRKFDREMLRQQKLKQQLKAQRRKTGYQIDMHTGVVYANGQAIGEMIVY